VATRRRRRSSMVIDYLKFDLTVEIRSTPRVTTTTTTTATTAMNACHMLHWARAAATR
jgi:hypothetical protein